MKGSLIIVSFFAGGLLLSYFGFIPNFVIDMDFSKYALLFLMFVVGLATGANNKTWEVLKKAKLKILLVPLSAITGTWLGVAIISLLLPTISIWDSLAVGSGFGYYSLSSILISETKGEVLGVIALVANILREITTLLLTPIIVRYFGKTAPIAMGGATSMDTTLPVISQYSGAEYVIISIFNGTILTLSVPIFVSLFISL